MSQGQFVHRELDNPSGQIRLVEVRAHGPNAPLELDLSIHSLVENPHFYAVSYTWGQKEFTESLIINGSSMRVTKNCHYALTQIHSHYPSSPMEHIYLWIDSICINQESSNEQEHQIAMMGDIYTKAAKVLACVGPHENDSELLNEVLEELKSFDRNLYSSQVSLPHDIAFNTAHPAWGGTREFIRSMISRQSYRTQLHEAFLAFANRDYWSRVWIIQEVAATARSGVQLEILCGSDKFSRSESYLLFHLTVGHQATKNGQNYGTDRYHCFKFVMDKITVRSIGAHQIFAITEDRFKCSRPEDKVYGLLSLVKWRDGFTPVRPLYHDSACYELAEALVCQTDWMSPFQIQQILKGLEVCYYHKQMKDLVAMRSRNAATTKNMDSKYPTHRFNGAGHIAMVICGNDANQLTASLVYSNDPTLPLKSVDKRAMSLWKSPRRDDKAQLLFAGSKVGALLCDAAQTGDLMIKSGYGRALLVLRYTGKEECKIVGQGLLCTGYEFPCHLPERVDILEERLENLRNNTSHRKEPSGRERLRDHVDYQPEELESQLEDLESELEEARRFTKVGYMTNIQLKAKPVEMIVLAGQDLEKDGSQNADESLRRLSTNIYGVARFIPLA